MGKFVVVFVLPLLALASVPAVRAGTIEVATYAADAFVPANSQSDFRFGSGGCRQRTSTDVARFVQDVQLPTGATLETLRLFFVLGSSGQPGIELSLTRNTLDGNVSALATAIADDSGVQSIEAPVAHTVDNDAGALVLEAELTGTGFLCAAQIEYSLSPSAGTSRSLSIDGRTFQPNRDFTSWTELGDGCSRFASSIPPFAAHDLELPQGARIEGLDIFYFDDNGSVLGELLVRLLRRDQAQLMPETLATVSSETSGGFGMSSVAVDHVVDSRGGALYLDWSQAISSSSLGLCGVRVRYTSTAPVPLEAGVLNVAGATLIPRKSEARHQPNNGCLDQLSSTLPFFEPFTLDVQLPHGAPVARLGISYVDNDPDEDIRVDLIEFDTDYSLFGGDAVATITSSGAAPELRTASVLPPFPYTVDNALNSLVLLARLEQSVVSPNLLLCNVFVDFGAIPDEVFANGFE